MSVGKSGRQIALENVDRFRAWIAERDKSNDWADYWRGDKLSRTDIAAECGFNTAALRQNPTIKSDLEALEARLRGREASESSEGKETPQNGSNEAEEANAIDSLTRRLMKSQSSAEKRVKALEEENAALKAQISMLREANKKYSFIDKYLEETGRMVRP
ncbi:VPA1267 family protein [Noviherbaspirillum soli]|uniref:VPA1267 family protein n=1 Tax=Noviherbaspirillum soli TaxID=1064518 RepID=UPI00188C64A9|nr:VPA1267 family protein [Noviherbaspirillum soli]